MAVSRSNICKNGLESLSRGGAVIYYASVFLYFWVFSTPVVSLVFGSYLYVCINWLNLHFDEAFSSLRIANYKSFTRFHIKSDGDLEVYTLAVDKVRNFIHYIAFLCKVNWFRFESLDNLDISKAKGYFDSDLLCLALSNVSSLVFFHSFATTLFYQNTCYYCLLNYLHIPPSPFSYGQEQNLNIKWKKSQNCI